MFITAGFYDSQVSYVSPLSGLLGFGQTKLI